MNVQQTVSAIEANVGRALSVGIAAWLVFLLVVAIVLYMDRVAWHE